ncbi:AsmA protein [Sinorhizobium terangae]|uniref:AsmA family protein n=1 Tax=Sinorhizobium terangae TaxID=110322 RepID=A0A6N7LD74_SINTE|nr:AsmA family protein [Sinorhizobium terangae]MBB4187331.1 AsmA protein [Sinorhizobium terangae]MQX14654.1 AsmA family protein [Sinorhizobium terangae]
MRRFFLCLLALGALAVASIAVLPSLVSSDWIRGELGRQLSAATGSSISLNGPVRLSAFPHLAVLAEDVTLSEETHGITAEIGEVAGSVSLSSLWSDRLHIKEIKLDRPVIVLSEGAGRASTTQTGDDDPAKQGDPLADLATFLERSAIDSISIANGTLARTDAAGSEQTVTDVDLSLSAPSIDDELSLSANARIEERRYETTLAISSLRSLLQRQPTEMSVSLRADPVPASGFAEFEAAGQVALNANGSYQIRGGKLRAGDHAFGLDALFIPGKRPRVLADLDTDQLDLSPFAEAMSDSSQPKAGSADSASPASLRFLADFDSDMSVHVGTMTLGDVSASDVSLVAKLKDGELSARLAHLGIDAGSLAANVSTDVRDDEPAFQGRISSDGLDIVKLASLMGQSVPLSGALTIDTAFAFRGLSEDALRETINLTGNIGMRDATFVVPNISDENMREVKARKLAITIEDLKKPVHVTGSLAWRDKPIAVELQIPIRDVLLAKNNPNATEVPLELQLRMPDASLAIDGKAALPSQYVGKLDFSTTDLDAFLAWLGRGGAESVGPLAFKGDVRAGPTGVSFKRATLSVNGVQGSGNGSVEFTTPLKIASALSFEELDFARLAGVQSPAPEAKAKKPKGDTTKPDLPLDLSALQSIDASIKVNAKKLGYGRVFAGPVATSLIVSDGVASIALPESPFYGGHVAASLKADGSQSEPSIALQASISGASAAPLLTDMAGFRHLEGALQAKLDIAGAGGTTKALANSLHGTANVRFSDGAIRGLDIADVYNNLVGLMSSGFKQDENKATEFTELGASFSIESGVARTEDIKLVGPLVRMTGTGAANLAESSLKFRLDPRVVASLKGQGAEISTDGVGVPVVVEGSFANPRIYPDLSGLLKDPGAALARLKKIGLPTEKLRIDDLLSKGKKGRPVEDLIRGGVEKMLQGKDHQLSIEEVIAGDAAKGDQAIPAQQAGPEPAPPQPANEQPQQGAEQSDQESSGALENIFNQLLR